VAKASPADAEADILLVGGGTITGTLVPHHPIVPWIARAHPKTTWTTSVCTGSLLLAGAGVLKGVEATTHWAAKGELAGLGAIPVNERVVRRGKIVTAAGVSAGIDMALTLAAEIAGADSRVRRLIIEYTRIRRSTPLAGESWAIVGQAMAMMATISSAAGGTAANPA
jgi:transcriptional regulator GlxA family with amidase domain